MLVCVCFSVGSRDLRLLAVRRRGCGGPVGPSGVLPAGLGQHARRVQVLRPLLLEASHEDGLLARHREPATLEEGLELRHLHLAVVCGRPTVAVLCPLRAGRPPLCLSPCPRSPRGRGRDVLHDAVHQLHLLHAGLLPLVAHLDDGPARDLRDLHRVVVAPPSTPELCRSPRRRTCTGPPPPRACRSRPSKRLPRATASSAPSRPPMRTARSPASPPARTST